MSHVFFIYERIYNEHISIVNYNQTKGMKMSIDRQNNLDLEPSKPAFCSLGQGFRWGVEGLKKTLSYDGLKYVVILFLSICVMMVFNVPIITQILMEFVYAACIALMISESIYSENRFSDGEKSIGIGKAMGLVFNKAFGKILLLYLFKFSVSALVFIALIVAVVLFFSHDLVTLFTPFIDNFTQNAFDTDENFNRYMDDVILQYRQTDVLANVSMNFFISTFLVAPLVLVTISFCIYCANFYAVPLLISSNIGVLKALWVSFVAVNKNILSFLSLSLVALFYLAFCCGVLFLIFFLAHILSMFIGTVAYVFIGFMGFLLFVYLFLSVFVFETYVRAISCFDVFWYNMKDTETNSKFTRHIP